MKSLKELGITEGPWFIPSANVWRVIGDDGKRIIVENAIAENVYFGQDKIGWEGVEDTSEAFHNNILIASAPEMLEELIKEWEFIESYLASNASRNDGFWYNEFLRRQDSIKNKILKATGKKWGEIV